MKSRGNTQLVKSVKRGKESLKDRRTVNVAVRLKDRGLLATMGAFNRVSRGLNRLLQGSTTDLRTPFFSKRNSKGKIVNTDRATIVGQFDDLVAQAMGGHPKSEFYDVLMRLEKEQREKIGPTSQCLPWPEDGPTKVSAVFSDKRPGRNFDERAWKRAGDRQQSQIPSQSCNLLSYEEAITGSSNTESEDGMTTSTNSGLPFAINPWKPNDDMDEKKREEVTIAYKWITRRVKELLPYLKGREHTTAVLPEWWSVAGQRLVSKGPDPYASDKVKRLILMMPKEEAILGKMCMRPIQEAMKQITMNSGNLLMAGWHDLPTVDRNCQKVLEHAHKNGRTALSGDIASFDSTVPPFAIMDTGRIQATWLRGGENLLTNLYKMMVYRTGCVTPLRLIDPMASSMKSGSALTSGGGSAVNQRIQYYGEEIGHYKIDSLMVLGDDFVIDGPGVSAEATADVFSHFGMTAHPDKQFQEVEMLHFLQRLHVLGRPGGIASVYRTLGSVMSLERLVSNPEEWSKFAYVIQALARLQNATFNPLFETLVKFTRSGDRLRLGQNLSSEELVLLAGNAGKQLIDGNANKPWKQNGVKFANWTVNGVVHGESLPHEPMALFKRAYGYAY
jgi:hypothetical protein